MVCMKETDQLVEGCCRPASELSANGCALDVHSLVKKSDCSDVGGILSVSCTLTGMGRSGMLAGVWFSLLMSKTYSKTNIIARSAGVFFSEHFCSPCCLTETHQHNKDDVLKYSCFLIYPFQSRKAKTGNVQPMTLWIKMWREEKCLPFL